MQVFMERPGQEPDKQAGAFKVEPGWEPASEEEAVQRLYYLSVLVLDLCRGFLREFWLSCQRGNLGEELKRLTTDSSSAQSYTTALKELTAVNLYLALLDCGGTQAPPWLVDFLSAAVGCLDRLVAGRPVREIMQSYEFVPGYDVCKQSAADMCRTLRIMDSGLVAPRSIEKFYLDPRTQHRRMELLQAALSSNIQEIRSVLELERN